MAHGAYYSSLETGMGNISLQKELRHTVNKNHWLRMLTTLAKLLIIDTTPTTELVVLSSLTASQDTIAAYCHNGINFHVNHPHRHCEVWRTICPFIYAPSTHCTLLENIYRIAVDRHNDSDFRRKYLEYLFIVMYPHDYHPREDNYGETPNVSSFSPIVLFIYKAVTYSKNSSQSHIFSTYLAKPEIAALLV